MTDKETLQKFAESASGQFLRFDENGEVQGIYKGVAVRESNYTPGTEELVITIEGSDGQDRQLTTGSKRLAKAILRANPEVGDIIQILRVGEKFETQFRVKIIGQKEKTQEEVLPPTDSDIPF